MNKVPVMSAADAARANNAMFELAIAEAPDDHTREFFRLQQKLIAAFVEWGFEARHRMKATEILAVTCEALSTVAKTAIHGMPPDRQDFHRLVFAQVFVAHMRTDNMRHEIEIRNHDA